MSPSPTSLGVCPPQLTALGATWQVVSLLYRDESMKPGQVAPYRLRLLGEGEGEEELTYAPEDTDDVIRKVGSVRGSKQGSKGGSKGDGKKRRAGSQGAGSKGAGKRKK